MHDLPVTQDLLLKYPHQVNEILDPEGLGANRDGADAEGDDDDSDEDMLVTQAELNLNCPITRSRLLNFMCLVSFMAAN